MIDQIRKNLHHVRDRIERAASRSGRSVQDIRLVAVTKRNSADRVRALIDLGVADLGENYPQELWDKAEALADVPARWHLIGHLQGNKAKKTAPLVTMIHSVDSLKLLRTLGDLAKTLNNPPTACLQVNCSGESAKHGWSPESILADADSLARISELRIVGLMTMAGYGTSPEAARPAFARLREIREALEQRTGLALPELSMGMSSDFEAAIEEGATIVRVGSALFEGLDG